MTTKNLLLKAKKQIYGDRLGNHATKFHGEGFEFSELREYAYGDDVRKIDWKSTAKTSKTYIKVYNEERELSVVVATMMGGSAYFGTVRQKSEVMREVVALIGTAAIGMGDTFSNYLFANKLMQYTKPTKRNHALHALLEQMNDFDCLGLESNYADMHKELEQRIKHKSLLYIVSDFVGAIDFAKLSKRHDISLIIVRDRFEEEPHALGFVGLVDSENGRSMVGNIDGRKISNYTKALKINDDKLMNHCMKYGIRTIKVYTDDDVYLSLARGIK